MNSLLSSSIKDIAKKIASLEIRTTELCDASLKLSNLIKPLNAFINVTNELASKQSRMSQEKICNNNKNIGSLEGIPIAMKDNFCTADVETTCASLMLANFIPGYDSTVYKKLIDAGATLIGKTNLDQFAMGSGTIDSYFGPTKNIYGSDVIKFYTYDNCEENIRMNSDLNEWYIAGGSSGGSAIAVATGACLAAIGSDSGGSTRNPAALCGVVGLKPTYGLVSRHGLIPLVNSMDVPGIITKKVDDACLILNTIAGPDPLDSTTIKDKFTPFEIPYPLDISGLRIGIPKEYFCPELSDEMRSCWTEVEEILEEGGARIFPVSLPHTKYSIVCYSVLNQCEVASNMARYDGVEYGYNADIDSSMQLSYTKTRSLGFNDVVRSRILAGNYFLLSENYEDYFVRAMKVRRLISQDFNNLWHSGIDLLLTPTTLSDAPTYSSFKNQDNRKQCSVQDYCTQPVNMAGLPAISLPIKLSQNKLPLSIQLIAPKFCEQRLLGVAKWIEDVVEFPNLRLKDDTILSRIYDDKC